MLAAARGTRVETTGHAANVDAPLLAGPKTCPITPAPVPPKLQQARETMRLVPVATGRDVRADKDHAKSCEAENANRQRVESQAPKGGLGVDIHPFCTACT